jgi:hypothetical protein
LRDKIEIKKLRKWYKKKPNKRMRTKSEKKNVEGENWKKKQIKKMIKKKWVPYLI